MDIQSYRRAETLACQSSLSWRKRAAHTPNAFLAAGFPTRVESIADLVQLVDTMQEDRFAGYMAELGGLNDLDLALLVPALAEFAKFFALTFDSYRAPLPFDTMLGMYVAYKKLDRFAFNARSVLEIGPGCGYLSFFMKQRANLEHYTQIECCESFYLLQYLVNRHCFDGRVAEYAVDTSEIDGIDVPPIAARVQHRPWWDFDFAHQAFDAVYMNAMLTELNPAALLDYIDLLKATLKPGGVIIAQCGGGGKLDVNAVIAALYHAGFPLTYNGTMECGFCVPTLVFTKALATPLIEIDPLPEPDRRPYTKDELTALVSAALR